MMVWMCSLVSGLHCPGFRLSMEVGQKGRRVEHVISTSCVPGPVLTFPSNQSTFVKNLCARPGANYVFMWYFLNLSNIF